MAITGIFRIAGHDYTAYVKQKSGIKWSRENTNDEDAGRDAGCEMHPNVTSHQRKLDIKLGPMPLEACMQLETDLQTGDNGVEVEYPDLKDGICTRLFYNTSISAGITRFTSDGVQVDDVSFSLITIREGLI